MKAPPTSMSRRSSSILTIKKERIAVNGTPSHSYGTSLAISDHTVLPATRHKWTRPALTPASKLVLDLPTPEGWKAELTSDLGHPAMHRPGVELAIFRSLVQRPTTTVPNQPVYSTVSTDYFDQRHAINRSIRPLCKMINNAALTASAAAVDMSVVTRSLGLLLFAVAGWF